MKPHLRPTAVALFVLLPSLACKALVGPPTLVVNQSVGTSYILRGVPQNENGVYQADATSALATEGGDIIAGKLWANVDLSNDTDALFPDGNRGQFTQLDVQLDYARRAGPWGWSLGLVSHNFPNQPARSTSEVFTTFARDDLWLRPTLSFYVDVEEANGLYANASVAHTWALSEKLGLDASALLGYTDDGQGELYYLTKESGLADFVTTLTLWYDFGEHTRFTLTGAGSTIVDDDLSDSVEAAGVDSENFRLAAGIGWSY